MTFASRERIARLRAMPQKLMLGALSENVEKLTANSQGHPAGKDPMTKMELFQRAFELTKAEINPRLQLELLCESEVVDHIRKGRLLAYGFEVPRRLASLPAEIPLDVLVNLTSLSSGKVQHGSLRIEEIRVLTPKRRDQIIQEWQEVYAPLPPKKPRGRPSTQRDIADAYEALRDGGQIDPAQPQNSMHSPIRRWLMTHRRERGYSETKPSKTSINETVGALVKADRTTGKSKPKM